MRPSPNVIALNLRLMAEQLASMVETEVRATDLPLGTRVELRARLDDAHHAILKARECLDCALTVRRQLLAIEAATKQDVPLLTDADRVQAEEAANRG